MKMVVNTNEILIQVKETSTRKLTVVQLSDETKYEGGNLEFGITDDSVRKTIWPRTRGSIIVFPSFLSHRVTQL